MKNRMTGSWLRHQFVETVQLTRKQSNSIAVQSWEVTWKLSWHENLINKKKIQLLTKWIRKKSPRKVRNQLLRLGEGGFGWEWRTCEKFNRDKVLIHFFMGFHQFSKRVYKYSVVNHFHKNFVLFSSFASFEISKAVSEETSEVRSWSLFETRHLMRAQEITVTI